MKRFIAILAALCVFMSLLASAEDIGEYDTLKAYWALISDSADTPDQTPAFRLLAAVLDGEYAIDDEDDAEDEAARDERFARALPLLCEIASWDIIEFAGHNRMPVAMVRHAYYKALANALAAEIKLNPASEEHYRNLQIVLQLFLSVNEDEAGSKIKQKERDTIRQIISKQEIAMFADSYALPTGFVEFLIMDRTWHDDNWNNDDAWADEYGWALDAWADEDDVRDMLGAEYVVTGEDVIKYLTEQDPEDDSPDDDHNASTDDGNMIGGYDDSPDDDGGQADDYNDSPDYDGDQVNEHDDSPDDGVDQVGEYDDSPDEDGDQVGEYDDSPDDNGGVIGEYDDSPDEDGDQVGEYDDSPDDNGGQVGDYNDSPDDNGGQVGDYIDSPDDDYDDSPDDDYDDSPDDDYDDSPDDDYDDSIDDD